MKNWTKAFGKAIPTAAEVARKVQEAFPFSRNVIMFKPDRDTICIQKNAYQPDEGFMLPVGDWGTYKHPKNLCKGMRDCDIPTRFDSAIDDALTRLGIGTIRSMSRDPAQGIVYNPNAIEEINGVLAYAMKEFMAEVSAKNYKVDPLADTFGVKLTARSKYVSTLPGNDLLADLKQHIEQEFNVLMGPVRADGTIHIDVLDYTCTDTKDELNTAFDDPANEHLGHLPGYLGEDMAKLRAFESFVMVRGKLTVFRHGYVAGMSTNYPPLRKLRKVNEHGGGFLVPGSSWEPAHAYAYSDYPEFVKRAESGEMDFAEIYRKCLPDYLVEELVEKSRQAHDREKAVAEQEASANGAYKDMPVSEAMPVAVTDLKAGDRFGAYLGGWLWCEVKTVEGNILHAWVINGAYDLPFDRLTGLVMPAYGYTDSTLRIAFTAPTPFKQHASYHEAIEFMEQKTGMNELEPV